MKLDQHIKCRIIISLYNVHPRDVAKFSQQLFPVPAIAKFYHTKPSKKQKFYCLTRSKKKYETRKKESYKVGTREKVSDLQQAAPADGDRSVPLVAVAIAGPATPPPVPSPSTYHRRRTYHQPCPCAAGDDDEA